MDHIRTSYLPSQDDISHPDSERELVLRGSLGVETGELGDELVRRSVDRYLRISPLWRLSHGINEQREMMFLRLPLQRVPFCALRIPVRLSFDFVGYELRC